MESFMTLPTARMLHDLGEMMVLDDKSDVGHFTYRNRKYHTYHGKRAPHHSSPIHHWQLGGLFMIIGQLAAMVEVAKEAQQDQQL